MSIFSTFNVLKTHGTYFKTQKRSLAMYCFGSTITATRYPKYIKSGQHKILPRPYDKCKPGHSGDIFLNSLWFSEFVWAVESATLRFLREVHPHGKDRDDLLHKVMLCRTYVPEELRICKTFFTHFTMLGHLEQGEGVPLHFDEKDIITALVHVGDVKQGGATTYYDGLSIKNKGKKIKEVEFRHGQIQIGCYNKILHGADNWIGPRLVFNFNIKVGILDHFLQEGDYYFNQYRTSGFPSGVFLAS